MNACPHCNQPLPTSDPYRTATFLNVQQDKPLPKFKPWLKRTMTTLTSKLSLDTAKSVAKTTAVVLSVCLPVVGSTYFGFWVNGCSVAEMRAAKVEAPIQVSPTTLYHEYHINKEAADAKYLDKPILVGGSLDEDFRVGNSGELLAPLKAGIYAQTHRVWIVYDPSYIDEIDDTDAFGNGQGSQPGALRSPSSLGRNGAFNFVCKSAGATNTISSPDLTPLLVDCRLSNGAERHYSRRL